ncbi:MAG: hypoxanthine phosphoribosyltransferase [Chloroflexi bacterium]|nr:hypoxanthine phosphoribosyltransferase [Chloroflexota bacterium]
MKVLLDEATIAARVRELGAAITADYRESGDLVLVGIMRGAVCFLADLMRAIDLPLRVGMLDVRSYQGTGPGQPSIQGDVPGGLAGADVVVVEDIIDRGVTLDAVMTALRWERPASVEVCALLRKPGKCSPRWLTGVKYDGFDIGEEFVVGYGLDYDQRWRNLPYVALWDGDGE